MLCSGDNCLVPKSGDMKWSLLQVPLRVPEIQIISTHFDNYVICSILPTVSRVIEISRQLVQLFSEYKAINAIKGLKYDLIVASRRIKETSRSN